MEASSAGLVRAIERYSLKKQTTSEITIEVSPEVAVAYLSASMQERKKIQSIVTILLQQQGGSDVALLREFMDEISDRAQSRGLTQEIAESILIQS